ncbi:SusC/RagA family TonB-linked outer membrane protein [Sediminibacterium ginsengisoli]|uniref:TonB-linked outer membrane protein, SusC/RagA family n=1 Tax=Sediminibacterium ginsengisoli TaxID=413434 RepID=A0A1T4Q302_9BACT|nr:TonB-dependent receptor [Sediminibacterium ginsengisoli]SJZ97871.1 TonB-linked outer membrane protein, SusC/RagA family [Sediminibacterium ginsengisoli]
MKCKFLLCCALLLLQGLFTAVTAQNIPVTGKVTSKKTGEPLAGATVSVKGTSAATLTDENGKFGINAKSGATLLITYQGMIDAEKTISGAGTVNIQLEENNTATLSDVVVIGYGTQKKSVVTGAISSVKAADIENQQINRIEQALQGRTSGVTIASTSGSPGAAATVRVRGVTSINANNPLWVIDGVIVDNGGIGYLNTNDIESIEVLKDAASAAIYGTRGAAGVILVTTKKGKAGTMRVNYNGYYGTQAPAKRLDLLDATQYATLRNEAAVNGGGAPIFTNPSSFGKGTDWQSVIFNESAPIQNHEVSLSGGGEKSTYYASFGYFSQTGIVASDISNWKRYSLRLNSTHKIGNYITFAQNLGFARTRNQGISTNTEFGGPLSSAINLDPITPVVITDPAIANAAPYSTQPVVRDDLGRPYGISQYVQQEMTNPAAFMRTQRGNFSSADDIVGNAYVEVEPIKGLKIRSTLGAKLSYWGGDSYRPVYYLNAAQQSTNNQFTRNSNQLFNWNIENTISYTKSIDKHNFTILAAQGAYRENFTSGLSVTKSNLPVTTFEDASMNFNVATANVTASASEGTVHAISSLFGRLNYNFDEKYLVSAIVRRDGSSRFGANHQYGIFPSGSIGWVPTREEFWRPNNILNTLKVRASYGVNGSDEIGNFGYVSTIGGGRNYPFGVDNLQTGYSPNAPSNPDLKWEQTSQLDLGFDAVLFRNLTLSFDWYYKKTTGILRSVTLPGYVGSTGSPVANIADMNNKGVEIELGYRKEIGKLNFDVRGNVGFVKNEVTYLGDNIAFIGTGANFQNSDFDLQRTSVGLPYNYFFGFRTAGIFQNQKQIDDYVGGPSNTKIQPNAKPGDFRWVDANNDGRINGDDRVMLGNAIPTMTYGITLNMNYKNFDFLLFGQGVSGNKIYQGLRRLDIPSANWQTKALNRWTGENTSNSFPRLSTNDANRNFAYPSDFTLESGAYFRIKTLQVGYTLPRSITSKAGIQRVRFYLSSNNLLTITKYTGYDPEVGGAQDVFGSDNGVYPQSRSFLFGVNIGF